MWRDWREYEEKLPELIILSITSLLRHHLYIFPLAYPTIIMTRVRARSQVTA